MVDTNEKFKKALELQEQGVPRSEIWKLLEYKCVDPLTRMFRKRGYKYNDLQGKYVLEESYKSNTYGEKSNTSVAITKPVNEKPEVLSVQVPSLDEKLQENIIHLANQYDAIQEIIEWYKVKDTEGSNTEVIQVVQGLHIDLPPSETIMVSTRSNKVVWERFNKFCESHNQFKKGDLLAKALLDLIETYEKK